MLSVAALTPAAEPATLCGITLILGGARAGKSAYAEGLIAGALNAGETAIYIATAEARDQEMADRIRAHRDRRGAYWETCESPLELPDTLRRVAQGHRPVLVDCLTLWVSNLLGAARDVAREADHLVAALQDVGGPIVLVSNEVGLGIVPDNALARAFRDHVGRLHQAIAGTADRVVFVAAGLPLVLKEKK